MSASRKLRCHFCVLLLCMFLTAITASASDSCRPRQQNSSGVTWAMQAMAGLTGGNTVSSVSESGSVTRTIGNDQEMGTVTLKSSGIMTNQVVVSTNAGNRSETRSWSSRTTGGQRTVLDG